MGRRRLVPAVLAIVLLAAGLARAEPAGIVMAITGDSDPKLSAMGEIPADVRVALPAGASLTFLHYGRCKLVTVSGGAVTLGRTDYRTDGKIESEKEGPCPRIYALDSRAEVYSSGELVARGAGSLPRWPVNPAIILTGRSAGAVAAAAIFAEGQPDKPVAPLDLAGGRATVRDGGQGMVSGGRYVLRLTLRDRPAPLDIPFIAMIFTSQEVVVVRID